MQTKDRLTVALIQVMNTDAIDLHETRRVRKFGQVTKPFGNGMNDGHKLLWRECEAEARPFPARENLIYCRTVVCSFSHARSLRLLGFAALPVWSCQLPGGGVGLLNCPSLQ